MHPAAKKSSPAPDASGLPPDAVPPQGSAATPPPRWGLLSLAVLAALLTAVLIGADLLAAESVPTAKASPQATPTIR